MDFALPDRRAFLALARDAAASFLPESLGGGVVEGHVDGPNGALGHHVGEASWPALGAKTHVRVAIVGGGVAGLSAAWELRRQGVHDFVVYELESRVGGNAASYAHPRHSHLTPAPLGAHYVTMANEEATDLRTLFQELGIITAHAHEPHPVYEPAFCCYDLNARVLAGGVWEKGLLPLGRLSAVERQELDRFETFMDDMKNRVGRDGKPWFALPTRLSSADPEVRALDAETFEGFLRRHGFQSAALHWYARYCCRDDFGTEPSELSAWVGVHYFAAHRGRARNVTNTNVLTWPEGNAWIVNAMRARLAPRVKAQHAVVRLEESPAGVRLGVLDVARGRLEEVRAERVIVATPSSVAAKLVPGWGKADKARVWTPDLLCPWMVANIHVPARALERGEPGASQGAPLAWDNVPYQGRSLGYVVASHQKHEARPKEHLLTLYEPFSALPPGVARARWRQSSERDVKTFVLDELERMHPGIRASAMRVDTWFWPHAMPKPAPGRLSALWAWNAQEARAQDRAHAGAQGGTAQRVYHAHSDRSGVSLFEEAHDWGTTQARACARGLG